MKHVRAQREPPPVNHTIYPVFNEENAGSVLAAGRRTAITLPSWRRLDGNVQTVTELQLAHLGVGCAFDRRSWFEGVAGEQKC